MKRKSKNNSTKPEEKDKTLITVVYCGKRQSINEIFHQFYILNKEGNLTDSLSFTKMKDRFILGGIYCIKQSGKTTYFLSSDKYIQQFPDKEEVIKWSIKQNAAIHGEKILKEEKKLLAVNPTIEHICKPLRLIVRNMTINQRQALLAYIINILTH